VGRGSIVSGWHFQPLSARRRAERDGHLRVILDAARALVEANLVRCTDFAFEQRVVIKRPVPDRPGVYRTQEAHTLAPDASWWGARPEGEYRLELCVQVQQEERGAVAPEAAGAAAVEHREPRRRRRRRRRGSILSREDMLRLFRSFGRQDVPEERDVCASAEIKS
jgi:hypothetical protein